MILTPCQPIACSQNELYEVAIMRGDQLKLLCRDKHNLEHQETVIPQALQTHAGAEYLIFQCQSAPENKSERVRLDRIAILKEPLIKLCTAALWPEFSSAGL